MVRASLSRRSFFWGSLLVATCLGAVACSGNDTGSTSSAAGSGAGAAGTGGNGAGGNGTGGNGTGGMESPCDHCDFYQVCVDEMCMDSQCPFPDHAGYATTVFPTAVTEADFDGDGTLDMAVLDYVGDNVAVFLNKGDGTFGDPVQYDVGGSPKGIAVEDFDGDGKLDIAVACSYDKVVDVLLNEGAGTFAAAVSYPAGYEPVSIAAGDFDGDGYADLVAADDFSGGQNNFEGGLDFLPNKGDGTFGDRVFVKTGKDDVVSAISVATGDFDGDGDVDVAAGNKSTNGSGLDFSVLLNDGTGAFVESNYGTAENPTDIVVHDFDGNGALDLVFRVPGEPMAVLLNQGEGTFVLKALSDVGYVGAFALDDFDGDGNLDVATSQNGHVVLWSGDGSGGYAPPTHHFSGDKISGMAAGDLDGNGKPDLAVVNYDFDSNVKVLLNTCAK